MNDCSYVKMLRRSACAYIEQVGQIAPACFFVTVWACEIITDTATERRAGLMQLCAGLRRMGDSATRSAMIDSTSPINCTTPEHVSRDNGRQSGKDLTTSPTSSGETTCSEGTTRRTTCRENANF